jgi:hypothetical protein
MTDLPVWWGNALASRYNPQDELRYPHLFEERKNFLRIPAYLIAPLVDVWKCGSF